MSFEIRALFWGLAIFVLTPACIFVALLVQCALPRAHPSLWTFLAAALLTLPTALLITHLHTRFAGAHSAFALGFSAPVLECFLVLCAALGANLLIWPSAPKEAQSVAHALIAPPEPRPKLYERLPAELQSSLLISISMQDHYANIVTTKGSHLMFLPLKGALEELGHIEGMQVHRSHWVAADQAVSITRKGRKHLLTLKDGRTLPVSQTYLNDVKDLLASRAGA